MVVYVVMIYCMDIGIGQVMQVLKNKGFYENIVIVFVFDNGVIDVDIFCWGLNDLDVLIG